MQDSMPSRWQSRSVNVSEHARAGAYRTVTVLCDAHMASDEHATTCGREYRTTVAQTRAGFRNRRCDTACRVRLRTGNWIWNCGLVVVRSLRARRPSGRLDPRVGGVYRDPTPPLYARCTWKVAHKSRQRKLQ